MTSPHSRKLKIIEFTVDAVSFQCQLKKWQILNNTPDGGRLYAFCPDGESIEDGEDDYALELEFYADWRSGGISDFLVTNDKQVAAFQLDHHPDIPAEHTRHTGQVKIKAPNIGGDVRTTELTAVTLMCISKPTYVHL